MIEVEIYTATPTDWEARGVFLLTDDGQIEAHAADGAENLFEMIQKSPIPIGDKVYTAGGPRRSGWRTCLSSTVALRWWLFASMTNETNSTN